MHRHLAALNWSHKMQGEQKTICLDIVLTYLKTVSPNWNPNWTHNYDNLPIVRTMIVSGGETLVVRNTFDCTPLLRIVLDCIYQLRYCRPEKETKSMELNFTSYNYVLSKKQSKIKTTIPRITYICF